MGMKVSSFMTLQNLLEDHGALYDSKHVTATKKLGILLYMLITGLSNRKLQQRFQRSASTISITINQLVKDITCNRVLIQKFINLPADNAGTPDEIKLNPKPQSYQELFNLRHASARNVIERIFGVIKHRFQVINAGCYYNISIQVKVIIVMAFIHNFIRVTDPTDIILSDEETTLPDPRQPDTVEYGELHHRGITRCESTQAAKMRNGIAKKMWSDYQRLIRSRQRHSRAAPTA
ncbi:hypothetical protein MJO28_003314 [Puccinia striiformis f. sp. tritici]|uniref:Uncharacterized protein n=1 Tax=Puccinia striiformis f. sp. tritici TaxID=168172 RepID=A0ACC0ETX2_9BASI|nr:hypothetical protein MJO28_003314 [Puccinia striiformis f. sp. tritici]